jgi:hypothetical protein
MKPNVLGVCLNLSPESSRASASILFHQCEPNVVAVQLFIGTCMPHQARIVSVSQQPEDWHVTALVAHVTVFADSAQLLHSPKDTPW